MKDDKPEIEPRLPDELLPRLEELHRRKERRGLTELEKMVVANDCENFIDGMKPIMSDMAEVMTDVMNDMVTAMTPVVESISKLREEMNEEFEPGDER
mgnify:CR=1 FL=1